MNHATEALLALLERRAALRVLWALRGGEAQPFRALQAACGELSPSTLSARLRALRDAGIVEHVSGSGYRLTAAGRELVPLLLLLDAWAQRHGP